MDAFFCFGVKFMTSLLLRVDEMADYSDSLS